MCMHSLCFGGDLERVSGSGPCFYPPHIVFLRRIHTNIYIYTQTSSTHPPTMHACTQAAALAVPEAAAGRVGRRCGGAGQNRPRLLLGLRRAEKLPAVWSSCLGWMDGLLRYLVFFLSITASHEFPQKIIDPITTQYHMYLGAPPALSRTPLTCPSRPYRPPSDWSVRPIPITTAQRTPAPTVHNPTQPPHNTTQPPHNTQHTKTKGGCPGGHLQGPPRH